MRVRSFAVVPLVAAATFSLFALSGDRPAPPPDDASNTCAAADTLQTGADYYTVSLRPPASSLGDRNVAGRAEISYAQSPFGLSLTRDGTVLHRVRIILDESWRMEHGRLVAWVASPDLDHVRKLGEIGADGTTSGEVALNKYLVFVTEEAAGTDVVDRWNGPVVLKGKSRSGRMQSMASHGMFEREPC